MPQKFANKVLRTDCEEEMDTYCDQEVAYEIYYRMGIVRKILCPVPALLPDLLFVNLADHA